MFYVGFYAGFFVFCIALSMLFYMFLSVLFGFDRFLCFLYDVMFCTGFVCFMHVCLHVLYRCL